MPKPAEPRVSQMPDRTWISWTEFEPLLCSKGETLQEVRQRFHADDDVQALVPVVDMPAKRVLVSVTYVAPGIGSDYQLSSGLSRVWLDELPAWLADEPGTLITSIRPV